MLHITLLGSYTLHFQVTNANYNNILEYYCSRIHVKFGSFKMETHLNQ